MNRAAKIIIVVACGILLVVAALYTTAWLLFGRNNRPSNIVDFSPVSFPAKANSKFFYSIGKELKYSDQIEAEAPTVLSRGRIDEFLVSPDSKKIAVVSEGKLAVVGAYSGIQEVTPVDSIYREPKEIGKQFFRDDEFQWSEDSKTLYLIRDEYYQSSGSQLFSDKGELWSFDTDSVSLQPVLKPFRAYTYFFAKSGIYFSVPTGTGDLELWYFDGKRVVQAGASTGATVPGGTVDGVFRPSVFYSFSILDYQRTLSTRGVDSVVDRDTKFERLLIRGKPYLELTAGQNIKGPYWCADTLRSVFLPGDQYFLFNVPYCGNYDGQLLIDTTSGKYEALPKDSVVYLTLNTKSYPHYRVTGGGIEIE